LNVWRTDDITISSIFSRLASGVRLEPERSLLLDEAGADVRRHDDDGVLEIDRIAKGVCQDSVFKHL
jgi:hypothetical protein